MKAAPSVLFASEYPGPLQRGMSSPAVRHLQEWLCLHGFAVDPDGDFGGATQAAVMEFQAARALRPIGTVDETTWQALEAPLVKATAIIQSKAQALPDVIIGVARRHLEQRPREVGGPNSGPWVRYYMQGHEGAAWPWCAGFVSSVVRQALVCAFYPAYGFVYTYSCDVLMQHAQKNKRTIPAPVPGCIFVKRGKAAGDWVHTGIVVEVPAAETFKTIEGNTNTTGSREGIAVCSLTRAAAGGYDFILVS